MLIQGKSKYSNIQFPIFCLKREPYSYSVTRDEIYIETKPGSQYQVDKFQDNTTYLFRYVSIKPDEFQFDATCLNLTQLIKSKVVWGIDAKARVHNLKKKQEFKARSVKIIRVVQDYIWVDSVSYPFKLGIQNVDAETLLEQWATIVYIDQVWHVFNITSFKQEGTSSLKL